MQNTRSSDNNTPASRNNLINNDEERESSHGSGLGQAPLDLNINNRIDDHALQHKIKSRDALVCDKIRNDHRIHSRFIDYLLLLKTFEIVIVCDDSGSMNTEVDGTHRTRWDELCEIVKRILRIAVIFDTNGVDMYFLNEGQAHKIKNPEDVDHLFSKTPSDYTPLVPVLREVFQSSLARRGREKNLLVFVATDGEPTNDDGDPMIEQFEDLMRHTRIADTTYVSFLLCTDERKCVEYMAKWDREMVHVDVTDDYDTEREKICQCQGDPNYPFTYDDYIVKALIGSIVPHIDRLNESRNINHIESGTM